jgi:hypothetical protein
MKPLDEKERLLIEAAVKGCVSDQNRVTGEAVLEQAKGKESVLYKYFEWDDSIAAHEHRLDTARRIIRWCRGIVLLDGVIELRPPEYLRDPKAEDKSFVPTAVLRTQKETHAGLLEKELRLIKSAIRRALMIARVLERGAEFERLLQAAFDTVTLLHSGDLHPPPPDAGDGAPQSSILS